MENLTSENFNERIKTGVAVVDFWAAWCGPCMMQGPIFEKVAGERAGKAAFFKLNVDENEEIALRYKINAIPAILVFKNGELVKSAVGLQREEQLSALVNGVL